MNFTLKTWRFFYHFFDSSCAIINTLLNALHLDFLETLKNINAFLGKYFVFLKGLLKDKYKDKLHPFEN